MSRLSFALGGLVFAVVSACSTGSKNGDVSDTPVDDGGPASDGGVGHGSHGDGDSPSGDGDSSSDAGSHVDPSTPPPADDDRMPLREGWRIQAAAQVNGDGAAVGSVGFAVDGWHPASVPSTVLAALVADQTYPDPYVGDALTTIPSDPFAGPWWYRIETMLPAELAGQAIWLNLDGINYRAEVWLNGQRVAADNEVVGAFTSYEWDVTELARPGELNALAVKVSPPDLDRDLTITWRDWNPAAPDRDMGIWQDAYLKHSGPVAVRGAHVLTTLDGEAARLTIKTELRNPTASVTHATITATIAATKGDPEITVSQEVDLNAGEVRAVEFTSDTYPALLMAKPRLWWPTQLGAQPLYRLEVRASVDDAASDRQAVRFGIREVTSLVGDNGARSFGINGVPVFIRGGGWASDLMLRPKDDARLDAEFAYTRDLGLNTIRLEGKLETDSFYDHADELGVLVMPGWMCCDRWQQWDTWSADEHAVAKASVATQARRLRNHPSVITFLIGSDLAPPEDVEHEQVDALNGADWSRPIMPSASGAGSQTLGASGVKMTGPYDWVAPSYWYLDTERGGAFGFNTETGPGPAIPELESLEALLSDGEREDLWKQPGKPLLHAGGGDFGQIGLFGEALAARHGAPQDLDDYVHKAQLMNYEAERAEYEAYGRNKYKTSTGIIHWLLNNSWPSLIWHLYGYDLAPAAGYFGAKKANEPLHIQYSYDDRSVVVVNNTHAAVSGLHARAQLVGLDAKVLHSEEAEIDVDADAVKSVVTLPDPDASSSVYFVMLTLTRDDKLVSANCYWFSQRDELIDFTKSDYFHTATKQFADLTGLNNLPMVALDGKIQSATSGDEATTTVTVKNSSQSIALMARLSLTHKSGGAPVLPVRWSDNYLSLMPGETRVVTARYLKQDLGDDSPGVSLSGWNVSAQTLE